jgi:hypothetical protein
MGRAHHDALEHGLAADQGLFAAFKRWQKLDGNHETYKISQRTHDCWMLPARKRTKH